MESDYNGKGWYKRNFQQILNPMESMILAQNHFPLVSWPCVHFSGVLSKCRTNQLWRKIMVDVWTRGGRRRNGVLLGRTLLWFP
jgi:hypothetical protein